MLSIDDIREKRFEKAVFGGYDARSVDEFMDEIVSELMSLQKEKATMQQKLHLELERNQEFVALENSMRKALMSAQEISNDMVSKAENKRNQILDEVKESAQEQISTYRNQIEAEKQKLNAVRNNYNDFVAKVSSFYESKSRELAELTKDLPIEQTFESNSSDFGLDPINEIPASQTPNTSVLGYGNKHESMTENILEKLKQESFNPQLSAEANKNSFDAFAKTNPKIQISKLEFGKNS